MHDNAAVPHCNIDSRGRVLRVRIGLVLLIAGSSLAFIWAKPSQSAIGWTLSMLLGGAGLFALLEARLGWCAARAAGFRTRF